MAQKLKHLHKIILSRKCNLIKTFSQQFLLPKEQQQFHSPPKKCPITCKKHYNLRRLLRTSLNALKLKRNKFNHSQTKYLIEIIETHYFSTVNSQNSVKCIAQERSNFLYTQLQAHCLGTCLRQLSCVAIVYIRALKPSNGLEATNQGWTCFFHLK